MVVLGVGVDKSRVGQLQDPRRLKGDKGTGPVSSEWNVFQNKKKWYGEYS